MCLSGGSAVEVTAYISEDMSLYCNVTTSSSNVKVDWWLFRTGQIDVRMCLDNEIIHLPEKYALKRTTDGYKLIVNNVNEDDSGKYVCRWRTGQNEYFVTVISTPTTTSSSSTVRQTDITGSFILPLFFSIFIIFTLNGIFCE